MEEADPPTGLPFFRALVAHRTFGVLLATIVLMELAHGIELIALFPLYLRDQFGEGADLIGLSLSAYLAADILTRTPAGWLADRWGRKPMLVSGILLSAFPLVVMPRVESHILFLALNGVNGVGAGCIWPAIYAAVADAYGRDRYGLVLGIVNMVMLGGIALGPIAGGFLLSQVSYRDAFVTCFVIVVAALALVIAFMRGRSTGPSSPPVTPPHLLRALVDQFNPPLLQLLLIGLALTLALGLMLPLVSLFGRQVLHLSPGAFALVLIPPAVMTATLIIPAGHWADRHGRTVPQVLGLTLIAIPFVASPLSTNPIVVSAGITVAGIGYALFVPAWNALVMEWVPMNARGLFLGAVATAQGIGLAVGPTLGGAAWERMGPYAPFHLAALCVACALLLALKVARRPRAVLQSGGAGRSSLSTRGDS